MMTTNKEISQKVLRKLNMWEIDPTPEKYALLFDHYSGANPALSAAMESQFAGGANPTSKELERLYARFLADYSNDNDELENLAKSLVVQSSGLQGLAHALSSSASSFGADIQAEVAGVTDLSESDCDVGEVINNLVELTKRTVQQNKMLERKLDAAIEDIGELHDTLKRAEEHAQTDFLTKLPNRRKFDEFLRDKIEDSASDNEPLSLIVGDVDHFKMFNDKYGHKVGDQVLVLVSNILRKNIKGKDLAARYGGEEFVIALPNTTLDQAAALAEHIRREIANRPLALRKSNKEIGNVTISFGVAEWSAGESEDALFEAADAALYDAKSGGRNKVAKAALRMSRSA
ncbi:GGDEF domain-containing protein [Hyphococcus sp.]|uniref:GGDEF domain-containing protein n=1 Tax=Hyphococcus sp. TaxID=2038636 RepID=UPI0035C707FE